MFIDIFLLLIAAFCSLARPAVAIAIVVNGYVIRNAVGPSAGSGQEGLLLSIGLPILLFSPVLGRLVTQNYKNYVLPSYQIDILLILLGVFLTLGCLYAPCDSEGVVIAARYWVLGLGYYFSSKFIATNSDITNCIKDYLATSWAIAFFTAVLALATTNSVDVARLTVNSVNPIPFSVLMGSALLISVYWILSEFRFTLLHFVNLVSVVIIGKVFIATNTRGTTVSFILAFALLLTLITFLHIKMRNRFQLLVISIFLVVAFLAIVLAADHFQHLQARFMNVAAGFRGESEADRISAYGVAVRMFLDAPLFGAGTGAFATRHYSPYPHNLLLELMAELGTIGLIIFLLLLLKVYRSSCQVYSYCQFHLDVTPLLIVTLVLFYFIEAQFSLTLWMQKNLFVALAFLSALSFPGRKISIDVSKEVSNG